jgi:hypothetical protein
MTMVTTKATAVGKPESNSEQISGDRAVANIAQRETGLAAMMERLATSPDVDVAKLERLLEMHERILDRQAEQEFSAAMARVQERLPSVLRASFNDQTKSKYANHDAIAKAIKPIYTSEGFSASFTEGETAKPDHIRVKGTLRHRDGHKDDTYYTDVAIDKTGIKGNDNKTLTHAEASSAMYGRRRLICMMFDVATGDDDDGNGAGGSVETIKPEQVAHLEKLIKEAKADRAQFLKTLEIEHLVDLPAKSFRMACVALKAKASTPARVPGSDDDK